MPGRRSVRMTFGPMVRSYFAASSSVRPSGEVASSAVAVADQDRLTSASSSPRIAPVLREAARGQTPVPETDRQSSTSGAGSPTI